MQFVDRTQVLFRRRILCLQVIWRAITTVSRIFRIVFLVGTMSHSHATLSTLFDMVTDLEPLRLLHKVAFSESDQQAYRNI